MISRFVSFKVIQGLHRHGIGNRNVIVDRCAGTPGQRLQRKFLLVPTLGLNFVGFVDDDQEEEGTMIERSRVLGSIGGPREDPAVSTRSARSSCALPGRDRGEA